jgi:hypothetical protein
MDRARAWLHKILEDNRNGYAESWTAPTISRFTRPMACEPGPGLDEGRAVARALPAQAPAPVAMEDLRQADAAPKKRARLNVLRRPAAASSQRDQNLAAPSHEQSVAGAPPESVSERGAPANVLRPPAPGPAPGPAAAAEPLPAPARRRAAPPLPRRPAAAEPPAAEPPAPGPPAGPGPAPAAAAARFVNARRRANLLLITQNPGLGCSKCRLSRNGCGECRLRLADWRFVHGASDDGDIDVD